MELNSRRLLLAVSLCTAMLRTLVLIWLTVNNTRKLRKFSFTCCSTGLAVTVFLFSALIYATTWLVHSLGILWESFGDLSTGGPFTGLQDLTGRLCELQTASLVVSTCGFVSIAGAELLVNGIFRKYWTKQVGKLVAAAIYLGALSLSAVFFTRYSRPQVYGSLLLETQVESNNITLAVDLLVCGVHQNWSAAFLGPVILASILILGILASTSSSLDGLSQKYERENIHIRNEGFCCCSSLPLPLGRAALALSGLVASWVLSWCVLSSAGAVGKSAHSGLLLGLHLIIMTAAIAANTCSTRSAGEIRLLTSQV